MIDEEPKSKPPHQEGLLGSMMSVGVSDTPRVCLDIAPQAIFKVLGTVCGIWLVIHIFPVLTLVLFALMLVATFNPVVRRWQTKLGRSWAIAAIVTSIAVLILGAFAILIPALFNEASTFYQRAPVYAQELQNTLAHEHIKVNVQKYLAGWTGGTSDAAPQLMRIFSSAVDITTGFLTVGILTIYLLIEGPQAATSVLQLLPRRERLPARRLFAALGDQVGGYMRGQLMTSALAGAFCLITLLVLQVPEALALGTLAALADAIPLVGLLIALIPAALMAFTVSPTKALIVVGAYLLYHQFEDHYIAPKVYGSYLGLTLSAIIISLLIGVQLMGMIGALLALPVAAAVPTIVAYIQDWQESHGAPDTSPLADDGEVLSSET